MIELEKDDGLWIARINRPEKANSLTAEMLEKLAEIALQAQDAKVFVLSGAGSVFSAGADLEEAKAGLAVSPVWEKLSAAIADLPGLSIAALNGTLAGGAMGMALACDIRVAVASAKFFYPVMKLGFLPQPSDPKRMTALIGPARTKLILMGGQKITAQEALQFGLVDQIFDDDVVGHAKELAADCLRAKPEVLRAIKALCH